MILSFPLMLGQVDHENTAGSLIVKGRKACLLMGRKKEMNRNARAHEYILARDTPCHSHSSPPF